MAIGIQRAEGSSAGTGGEAATGPDDDNIICEPCQHDVYSYSAEDYCSTALPISIGSERSVNAGQQKRLFQGRRRLPRRGDVYLGSCWLAVGLVGSWLVLKTEAARSYSGRRSRLQRLLRHRRPFPGSDLQDALASSPTGRRHFPYGEAAMCATSD